MEQYQIREHLCYPWLVFFVAFHVFSWPNISAKRISSPGNQRINTKGVVANLVIAGSQSAIEAQKIKKELRS